MQLPDARSDYRNHWLQSLGGGGARYFRPERMNASITCRWSAI